MVWSPALSQPTCGAGRDDRQEHHHPQYQHHQHHHQPTIISFDHCECQRPCNRPSCSLCTQTPHLSQLPPELTIGVGKPSTAPPLHCENHQQDLTHGDVLDGSIKHGPTGVPWAEPALLFHFLGIHKKNCGFQPSLLQTENRCNFVYIDFIIPVIALQGRRRKETQLGLPSSS